MHKDNKKTTFMSFTTVECIQCFKYNQSPDAAGIFDDDGK